ncbi:MAG: endopeptidase La [Nitrospira sp.]|nr:MAG: endopeptidase La [Nitrospira sp.]
MTGEISSRRLVVPIGGIKEKVLTAHRAGILRIILPKANEKNVKGVPGEERDKLTFILAERIEEVLTAAFNQDATTSTPAEQNEPLATSDAS